MVELPKIVPYGSGVDTELPSTDTLSPSALPQIVPYSSGATVTDTGEPVPYKSQDTFLGRMGITIDETQKTMYEGLATYGKALGIDPLISFGERGMERNEREMGQYLPSEHTASLTEEFDSIFAAEDLGTALENGGRFVKNATATVLGSMLPTVGSAAIAIPVGAVMGRTAAGATALAAPFLASTALGSGAVYSEAKKLGASEEDAVNAGALAGPAIGALDRLGASKIITGLVGKFGKEAVEAEVAKETGEAVAKSVVDKALTLGKKTGKDTLQTSFQEAFTEALQEQTQMSAAGLAAGKGVAPYTIEESATRLTDALALGAIGGAALGPAASLASERQKTLAAAHEKELDETVERLQKGLTDTQLVSDQEFGDRTVARGEGFLGMMQRSVRRATTPLKDLAKRSDVGARMVESLDGVFTRTNSRAGKRLNQLEDVYQNLKRTVKIPVFQRDVPKWIDDEIAKSLSDPDYQVSDQYGADMKQKIEMAIEGNAAAGQLGIRDILGRKLQDRIMLSREGIIDAMAQDKDLFNTMDYLKVTNPADLDTSVQDMLNGLRAGYQKIKTDIKDPKEQSKQLKQYLKDNEKKIKSLETTELQELKATGIVGDMIDAGVKVDFIENYYPSKINFSKKNKKKMVRILIDEFGRSTEEAEKFIQKAEEQGGFDQNADYDLEMFFNTAGQKQTAEPAEASFQKERTLSPEIRKRFLEEGIVDLNARGALQEYIFDSSRRIELQDTANRANDLVKAHKATLKKKSGKKLTDEEAAQEEVTITEGERKRFMDVFNAVNGTYMADSASAGTRKFMNWAQFYGYVLTMPLSALTALAEPFIVFAGLPAQNGLYGLMNAAMYSGGNLARSFFPKLPVSHKERMFRNLLQGFDGALAERFNEIQETSLPRKLTNSFFKLNMLQQVTAASRYMAFTGARAALRSDLKTILASKDGKVNKKELNQARQRLLRMGLPISADPEKMNPDLKTWALDEKANDPEIISQAMSKTVDDFIMAPNAVNKPLWMSNPYLKLFAQLKSFMFTFGNTVGYRMWRDVLNPVFYGKGNGTQSQEAAFRAALGIGLIMSVAFAQQMLRDYIRYGDEESPFDEMDEKDKFKHAFFNSGILGPFEVLRGAMEAPKFGSSPIEALAGPVFTAITKAATSIYGVLSGDLSPRAIANNASRLIPILNQIPIEGRPFGLAESLRGDIVDVMEEGLEDFNDVVGRKEGGRVVQRQEGGVVADDQDTVAEFAAGLRNKLMQTEHGPVIFDWLQNLSAEDAIEAVNFLAPIGQIEKDETGEYQYNMPSTEEGILMGAIAGTLAGKGKKIKKGMTALNALDEFPKTPNKWWKQADEDGMVTLYHGTTRDKLDQIAKEGLKPDAEGFTYASPDPNTGYGYSVMMGGEKKFMKGSQTQAKPEDRVVLELKIPADEVDSLFPYEKQRSKASKHFLMEPDAEERFIKTGGKRSDKGYEGASTYAATELRTEGGIPAEYIKGFAGKGEKAAPPPTTKPKMDLQEAGFGMLQMEGDDYVFALGRPSDKPSAKGVARTRYDVFDRKLAEAGDVEGAKVGSIEVNHRIADNKIQPDLEGLIDIEIDKTKRGDGVGTAVMRDLMRNAEEDFNVYDIKKKAKKFWDKLGATDYETMKSPKQTNAKLKAGFKEDGAIAKLRRRQSKTSD